MSGEWKPGDMVTWGHSRALRTETGWAYADGSVGGLHQDGYDGKRLLVVIDPEDREQIERLWQFTGDGGIDHLQAALREFANPTPLKPEEPTGRYAAVQTAEGLEYVRLGEGPEPWMCNGSPSNRDTYAWAEVPATRVLSEGVTP